MTNKTNKPERSVEEMVEGAYKALIHAKNAEGAKRDNYAKEGKLYTCDTYQWIITAMKYLDEYQLTLQAERQRCEEMVAEAEKRGAEMRQQWLLNGWGIKKDLISRCFECGKPAEKITWEEALKMNALGGSCFECVNKKGNLTSNTQPPTPLTNDKTEWI